MGLESGFVFVTMELLCSPVLDVLVLLFNPYFELDVLPDPIRVAHQQTSKTYYAINQVIRAKVPHVL